MKRLREYYPELQRKQIIREHKTPVTDAEKLAHVDKLLERMSGE